MKLPDEGVKSWKPRRLPDCLYGTRLAGPAGGKYLAGTQARCRPYEGCRELGTSVANSHNIFLVSEPWILLFSLSAYGFLPGCSGTTIRHNTQTTHITQNNTPHTNNTHHTK
jgi:hypothetical protein